MCAQLQFLIKINTFKSLFFNQNEFNSNDFFLKNKKETQLIILIFASIHFLCNHITIKMNIFFIVVLN